MVDQVIAMVEDTVTISADTMSTRKKDNNECLQQLMIDIDEVINADYEERIDNEEKTKSAKIIFEDETDGKEQEEEEESMTVTYDNSNDNYQTLCGIKPVRLERDENKQDLTMGADEDDIDIPTLKLTMKEYKKSVKKLDHGSAEKERRPSVMELKKNRAVKSKRALFEK